MKLASLVLALAMVSTTATAQTTQAGTPDSTHAATLTFPAVRDNAKTTVKYDRYRDSTIVFARTYNSKTPSFGAILMGKEGFDASFVAAFQYAGEHRTTNVDGVFLFTELKATETAHDAVKDFDQSAYSTMYLILGDGSRLSYKCKLVDSDIDFGGHGLGHVVHQFAAFIPTPDFIKIVSQDKVEGKIGATEFVWDGNRYMDPLRDVAALMNPALKGQ